VLFRSVSSREQESGRLQQQIRSIQSAGDASTKQKQAALAGLEKEVSRLEGERRTLSTQLTAAQNQKESTKRNFADATQRESTLTKINLKLKTDLTAAKTQIESLNGRIEKMIQTKQAFSKWKQMLAGKTGDVKPPTSVVAYLKDH